MEIDVDGNTLLEPADLQTVLEPFLGPGRKAEDVDQARETLEKLYRELGYRTVNVSIPQQTIKDGVIRLEVVEGRVSRLTVSGSKYTSLDRVRSEVPSLAEGQVPDFNQVERDLVYANRYQTRKVTPSLRAGPSPGTYYIDLNVEDHFPLHANAEYNNRATRGTTPRRAIAGLGYDNLFQLGHSASFTFQTAPERTQDSRLYIASYIAHIVDETWSLFFNSLKSDTDVSAFPGVEVVGASTNIGVKLVKQFPDLGGKLYPSMSLGVDYKKIDTVVRLSSATGNSDFSTPVRYYPLTLAYSQLLHLETQTLQSDLTLGFTTLATASSRDQLDFDQNRLGYRGQSFYLRGSNNYSLDLPAGFGIGLRMSGQITDRPLVSGEQFTSGGQDSVRGYLEAEVAGDEGASGSFELRGPSIPDLFAGSRWSTILAEFRPYAFFDAATVSLDGEIAAGTPRSSALTSYGGGLSIRIRDQFTATLDWALPLRDGPQGSSESTCTPGANGELVCPSGAPPTKKGDGRLLFRLSAQL